MKFDKKFKDEMNLLSPSEEQIERIKKGVYERIEREKSEPVNIPEPRKKPVWIKIAAISGTACAAALVVIVAGSRARVMLPGATNHINNSLKSNGNAFVGMDMAPTTDANGLTDEFSDYCGICGGTANDGSVITAAGAEFSGESGMTNQPEQLPYDSMVSAAPGSSHAPDIVFSEDKESCDVTVNGKTTVYKKAYFNVSCLNENLEYDLGGFRSVSVDLGKKLIVYFDENELYVFYESGEFFGYYKIK